MPRLEDTLQEFDQARDIKNGYPVGVSVILLNDENEVLLLQRADCGDWCCPGGKLEAGETVREGAARELHEEVGATIRGEFAHADFREGHYLDGEPFITVYLAAKVRTSIVNREPEKHTNMRWFKVKDIPLNTWGCSHILRYLSTTGWVTK